MSGKTQIEKHHILPVTVSVRLSQLNESSALNFNHSGSGPFAFNLCGVPGTYKYTALRNCANVTLNNCSDCNSAASELFAFLVATMGLSVLLGNSLILAAAARFYKKRTETKIDLIKASLAIADLLTGKSTKNELVNSRLVDLPSPSQSLRFLQNLF